MEGREEVSDRIPRTDEEEEMEVTSTIQQAVSYFTSNNNKVFISKLSYVSYLKLLNLCRQNVLFLSKKKWARTMFLQQLWTCGMNLE